MPKITVRRFSAPDETRPYVHGEVDILRFGKMAVAKSVFQPGWQWSRDVEPVAGTRSCQEPHALYVLSGQMHFVMDDGEEGDIAAGDYALIPPGHDAWTVGDEPCEVVDIPAIEKYVERRAEVAEVGPAP